MKGEREKIVGWVEERDPTASASWTLPCWVSLCSTQPTPFHCGYTLCRLRPTLKHRAQGAKPGQPGSQGTSVPFVD
jgi:hypothetical protein